MPIDSTTPPDAVDAFVVQTIVELERRQANPGAAEAEEPWLLQAVFNPDDPSVGFVYTVGLSWLGRPELYVACADFAAGGTIANYAASKHLGVPLEPGTEVQVGLTTALRVRGPLPVPAAAEEIPEEWPQVAIARIAASYRDVPLSMLQVIWPDTAGVFPGEAGYNEARYPQALMPVAS